MHRPGGLARVLGLWDVVLFHIVAVIGLRWLLTAARIGPSSIVLWLVAVTLFFVPQGLAVLELSARVPDEGGIYVWTKRAFGPVHGFICGWAYWVNNLIYYPTLIIFAAGNAAAALGSRYLGLADHLPFQIVFSLTILWLAVGLNIVGLKTGRWVQNAGAGSTWTIVVILVLLALVGWIGGTGRNPLEGGSLVPRLDGANINLWSSLCFALAGLELASVLGGEVRDPARTLTRSILVAAPLIAGVYIVGTLSVLGTMPRGGVDLVTGLPEAVANVGAGMPFDLGRLTAALLVIASVGGIGAWLAGTARIPFVVGLDRYLPPALGRVHPRWRTPHVALMVQGVGATLFIAIGALGSTVEEAYLVLVDTTIIVYFIPYLYLFLALPVLRRRGVGGDRLTARIPGGTGVVMLVAVAGFGTTAASIVLAALPGESAEPWLFMTKVIGGAAGLMIVGLAFYWIATRRYRGEGGGPGHATAAAQ